MSGTREEWVNMRWLSIRVSAATCTQKLVHYCYICVLILSLGGDLHAEELVHYQWQP